MRKIELDFNVPHTKQQLHEYLSVKFDFPEYYGKNLDALYDCLTEIGEPTAVGMLFSYTDYDEEDHDLVAYFDKVKKVFLDAEEDNDALAVFVFERY